MNKAAGCRCTSPCQEPGNRAGQRGGDDPHASSGDCRPESRRQAPAKAPSTSQNQRDRCTSVEPLSMPAAAITGDAARHLSRPRAGKCVEDSRVPATMASWASDVGESNCRRASTPIAMHTPEKPRPTPITLRAVSFFIGKRQARRPQFRRWLLPRWAIEVSPVGMYSCPHAHHKAEGNHVVR